MVAAARPGIDTWRSAVAAPDGERPLDLLGADAVVQLALEGAEQLGEVPGERVVRSWASASSRTSRRSSR